MKENKYDDISFFKEYKKMPRSVNGLKSAGEWHELKKVLPSFTDKRVLDLGCGFGWHCKYAAEHGAKAVVGVDISENMLNEAKRINNSPLIEYIRKPIEDIDYQENSFDVVISSLAFHYIKSFDDICKKVNRCLSNGGDFVFSVEHPIFTAHGNQDWCYDEEKNKLHWPVDNYFIEGIRKSNFLGKDVMKYHKTLTTYIKGLLINGFEITNLIEPMPEESMILCNTEMQDELRRPMMLIISARKKD
ncbi:class I SAM-dependent methyltransferase [Clostridium sp.]|uniref:class I SAM-dependent methyltransferase n=1 Tax=Clostridium sp. TaxID=1506 RepID=UPI001EBB37CF|nr:class I SAM-dependent methyltransferase [Clostridium sp.]MBS5883544.1 class I SAM-dependent methyltransferase [Clostridium sp.]MDU7240270.1 class I SAM-dependent methyltransferase [Clostridium sp.]